MILGSLLGLERAVQLSDSQNAKIEEVVREELFTNAVIGEQLCRNMIIMKELSAAITNKTKLRPGK